jgi:hypothetical protein
MKLGLFIIGACVMLSGGVWFLQGVNLLPGSYMTGQIEWAIYGGLAFGAGLVLLVWAARRGLAPPKPKVEGSSEPEHGSGADQS